MAGIQYKPVGVFWDIENCSIPKAKLPSDIIAHIRNFFVINRLNHREYEFIISCDVTRLRKDIPEDVNKAGGVTLAHVNGSSKNAADEKLRENMKKFVDTHASASSVSPVLILISGDIDFVNDLRGYQTRLGCTIVLIHASNCSPQFKVGWNEIYCFTTFCSAIKDNPALDSAANPKNLAKSQKNQVAPPQSKPNQNGPQNQQKQSGQPNYKNQGGQGNLENEGGPPGARNRYNDQKPYRPAQTVNKADMPPQQTGQFRPNPRFPNPMNDAQRFPHTPPGPSQQQIGRVHRFPHRAPIPPQQQGPQFDQAHKNKSLNKVPSQSNMNQPNTQQQQTKQTNNGGNSPPFEPPTAPASKDGAAANKFILMVGGLPGKMDFKILKDNLQFQANTVHGKVKYVKNGQAFITFKNKDNADRAVELFHGKQVFGKTLNVSFTKSIPFEDPANGKPKSGSDRLVAVEKPATTGGSKKPKNKEDNTNTASVSNDTLSNDPVLAGLGSIINGIVANRIAAAKPNNKSPESCPIQ